MSKNKKPTAKKKISVANGIINIYASFNNTIISITDRGGNVLFWSSAGKHGFKGSRKATPYAAQVATQSALSAAKDHGLQSATVKIIGPGVGRESALRAIQVAGIQVDVIIDKTNHPHNGCRPAKRRRV